MQQRAGCAMWLGSAMFIGAIGIPAIQKHWAAPLALVLASARASWLVGYGLFAAGAIITALGFALLGGHLRKLAAPHSVRPVSFVVDAFVVIGAICWSISISTTIFPASRALFRDVPLFTIYLNLSLFGFLGVGYLLIRAGYPSWLGWGTVGCNGLILILYLAIGDMPPAVLYLWPFILGMALMASRGPVART